MAENSYFFNSTPSDKRYYQAADFARYFGSVLTSGLLPNPYNEGILAEGDYGLKVYNAENSRVSVWPGHAIIKGYRYELTHIALLDVEPNTNTYGQDRIDRVILRLDLRNDARYIKVMIKKGTPMNVPQPPELERFGNVYELSLAQVIVRAGSAVIEPSDVTDERTDEAVCGFANSLITVPTSVFQQQFDAWFNDYSNGVDTDVQDWYTQLKEDALNGVSSWQLAELRAIESKVDNANATANAAKITAQNIDGKATQALNTSQTANNTANRAETVANATDKKLDDIILESGTSDAEVVAARTDNNTGETAPTIGSRIDKQTSKLQHMYKWSSSPSRIIQKTQQNTKASFMFIADDAPKNDLSRLMPIFIEKNAPVGIAVVTDAVGKNFSGMGEMMTWEEIDQCVKNGAFILAHTHKHRNSAQITLDELGEDLRTCKRILNERGYPADGLVFPYNATSYDIEKVARKYFNYAFSKAGALSQGYGRNFPLIDNMRIARIALGSFYDEPSSDYVAQDTSSLAYYKERVDEVITNNALGVFVLHTHTNNFSEVEQQQHLSDVIDYIRAQGAEIVDLNTAMARHANIVQVGSYNESNRFIMSADGKVTANDSEMYERGVLNSVTGSTAISAFTRGKITITPITAAHANANGLPPGADGLLYTYYVDTWYGNIYQKFVPYDSKKPSSERRLLSGSVWGAWNADGLKTYYDALNGRNGTDAPTTYNIGITHTLFNSVGANTNGMPYGRAGVLKTVKYSGENWAIEQTYETSAILDTQNSKPFIYKRYVNEDGTWTEWERVGNFILSVPSYATATTVTANNTTDITLNIPVLKSNDNITAILADGLPDGLMYQILKIENGVATIRIANVTGTDITFSNLLFTIHASR